MYFKILKEVLVIMKKVILILSILTFVVLISSQAFAVTVGFSSFQMGNDWNIQLWEGAKEVFDSYGWKVIHTNAQADTSKQLTALEGFLSSKVDAVVVGGGQGNALETAIKNLEDAGIPVITVDIASPSSSLSVIPNNYQSTEAISLFIVNKLKGQGKVAHLTIPGMDWYTVVIRDEVADLIFKIEGLDNLGILDSGLADAVQKSMNAVSSTLLSNPDLKAVYSSWGMPAIGAVKAIRKMKAENKVVVVCTDADRAVLLEMMKADSPLGAVAAQVPTLMGKMSAEYINKIVVEKIDVSGVVYPPMYIVTKEPDLVPPGIKTLTPDEAWDLIYPGAPKE